MTRRLAAGVGLLDFPFVDARGYWRWVDLCEADGADSLWHSDRLIGEAPVLECLSALAAIAGRTRRLKFGMNVLSVAMRDPVLCAKQCATIDILSAGRLLPAFGIGSAQLPDWSARNLDFEHRGARTDEALEIIARLWAGETFAYHGQHFTLNDIAISPKPVQAELPMWIGGSSPAAIRRTARFGTGWQGGLEAPEEVGRVIAAISAAAIAQNRPIDADHYGMTILFRFGQAEDRHDIRLRSRFGFDVAKLTTVGDADAILARVATFVRAGVSKFVMVPVGIDGDDVIDQTARLLKEVAPKIPKLSI